MLSTAFQYRCLLTLLQQSTCRARHSLSVSQKHVSRLASSSSSNLTRHLVNSKNLIEKHTVVSTNHLSPSIKLRLITPECPLWYSGTDDCPFNEPYWAFYWPGGQALTRFILDHPDMFRGKSLLDVGCGCGASAIAGAMVGARTVLANDIDPVAIDAVRLNMLLNNVTLETSSENLIGHHYTNLDVVLLGDMFYDKDFSNMLNDWLKELAARGTTILVGDPGRVYLRDHPIRSKLLKLMDYELLEQCKRENNGLSNGYVWQFQSNE
ncbi:electron transfer flavoprotein beta subunit lysine methyltransferase-like [Anneissia japonica]|uniref:electron transfer flavoprotein beta subunit lysine methyltransferase-like n=1 Tax=Anneissia japonica TaxID=1529436 RepID=UPI001425ADF6|nr:electron transfer flavoprotein beta subunit lysine methyltransferase-like [Anneissia japonica]XP_033112502.1 electron transfer flavoprotein beta subunit lysine methyltransferase-like [Anneissia japonica]